MKSIFKNKFMIVLILIITLISIIGVSYIILNKDKLKPPKSETDPNNINQQTDSSQDQTTSENQGNKEGVELKDKKVGSYIWFSGNNWRIINKSDDGIELISAKPVAILNFGLENNNYYDQSYLRKWLNQKYYTTLNNKELLKTQTYIWRKNNDGTTNSVTDYIGLLTKEEYVKNKDILNMSKYNWTMSAPSYIENQAYYVSNNGKLDIAQVDSKYGVSPIIKLINNISIKDGNGTKELPYRIVEERIAKPGEKLNTRHSGEYVSYSGLIWRVVDINQNLTTKLLYNNVIWFEGFDTRNIPVYDKEDKNNIANYLNTVFYGNLSNNNWLVMSDWYMKDYGYIPPVEDPNNPPQFVNYNYDPNNPDEKTVEQISYERRKIESISAYVGLLRFGELLTTTDISADWWLITQVNDSSSKLYYIYYLSGIISQTEAFTKLPARPAINLDSAVYITGGDGTLDNPYKLAR
ncbi:MAG: hypothetical protein A2Y24_08815 [Clostridiales bacterium GWE2_32_10]|nr:MAG: hypothetical protein A2Y24_08815 [Clostridiales bacterium GWE2_32_10]